ncbi:MAG: DUF6263 family protein [Planctomycetota bacterium]
MNPFPSLRVSLGLALIATALPAQGGEHLLRFHYKEGTTGHRRMHQQVSMQMDMAGQAMSTEMDMQMFMKFHVAAVDDQGTATVEHSIDRIIMKMDNPMMGGISFDSSDDDADAGPMDRMLDMVGQTITAKVDGRGQVQDLELPPALANAGMGLNMEETMGQMMVILPEDKVSVGDTWTSSYDHTMGQMGKVKMNVHNTLTGVDGDSFTVKQVLNMTMGDNDMGMNANIKDAVGSAVVSLGELMPKQMTMDMGMTMGSEDGPMPMNMDMTVKISLDSTTEPVASSAPSTSQPTSQPTSRKSDG